MGYNKDYTIKTAKEWLAERKWTAFLMRIPADGEMHPYLVNDPNDLNSIRSTVAMLNANDECDREFKIKVDFENGAIAVTSKSKSQDGNA